MHKASYTFFTDSLHFSHKVLNYRVLWSFPSSWVFCWLEHRKSWEDNSPNIVKYLIQGSAILHALIYIFWMADNSCHTCLAFYNVTIPGLQCKTPIPSFQNLLRDSQTFFKRSSPGISFHPRENPIAPPEICKQSQVFKLTISSRTKLASWLLEERFSKGSNSILTRWCGWNILLTGLT